MDDPRFDLARRVRTRPPREVRPCARCGDPGGYAKVAGWPAERYDGGRFGLPDQVCRRCVKLLKRRAAGVPERAFGRKVSPRMQRALDVVREIVGADGKYDMLELSRRTGESRRYLAQVPSALRRAGVAFPWRAHRVMGDTHKKPVELYGKKLERAKAEARAWFRRTYEPGVRYEPEDRDPLKGPWRAEPTRPRGRMI